MKLSMGRLKEIIKEELFYREFYRNSSASIINEEIEGPEDINVKQILELLNKISTSVPVAELAHIQITLNGLLNDAGRPEK